MDGYAHGTKPGDMSGGENARFGGLVNFDMTPKPAYHVLKKLIHEIWNTQVSADSANQSSLSVKGFTASTMWK